MTITRGRSQEIAVRTNPPGATVAIRPAATALTSPVSMTLPRKPASTVNVSHGEQTEAAYLVTASMPGYKDAFVPIVSRASSQTYLRNLIWVHPLVWGLGLAADFSTGAAYDLVPSSISIDLEPREPNAHP